MEVFITNETTEKKWNRYKKNFIDIVNEAIKVIGCNGDFNLSVIFVDSQTIQAINKEYRHKDVSTDVISFALMDEPDAFSFEVIAEEKEIGDIFINIDAIYAQAKEYQHTLKREVCFLFTHGLLHLLGYDHLEEADEVKMFALQEEILKNIAPRKFKTYE